MESAIPSKRKSTNQIEVPRRREHVTFGMRFEAPAAHVSQRPEVTTKLALISRNKRIAPDICDGCRARLTHDDLELTPQKLDYGFNAFLAE